MATAEKVQLEQLATHPSNDLDPQMEKINTTWDDTTGIDPALDKRITRKFDYHVVPWLFGLWLLAFIDRRFETSTKSLPDSC